MATGLRQQKAKRTDSEITLLTQASDRDHEWAVSAIQRLSGRMTGLPQNSFEAANTLTARLLNAGWRYNLLTYQLSDMLRTKRGNCLGLTYLYGALLKDQGHDPRFELVIGPVGYQRRDEQQILEMLLGGQVFDFRSPLVPEKPVRGCELLHFCSLQHPRLVLDGERFETTALAEQGPSKINGESVRELRFQDLISLVLYERVNTLTAGKGANLVQAEDLLNKAIQLDPNNREALSEMADLALQTFHDEAYDQAKSAYLTANGNDSQYFLQRHYLTGEKADLDAGLRHNPTDMRLWAIRNILFAPDSPTQRANFAVAAQCVARSEILDLGNFYAQYAWLMAKLFPRDAVGLLKQACNIKTNPFAFHFALAALGSCKEVKWVGKTSPNDHVEKLFNDYFPTSPLEQTRLLYIARRYRDCESGWHQMQSQFQHRRTFQEALDSLQEQWG